MDDNFNVFFITIHCYGFNCPELKNIYFLLFVTHAGGNSGF